MASEYSILMSILNQLHNRYFHALSAFYAYEGMLEIAAPNIVGDSVARANVKTMEQYNYFFVIAKEALKQYFFLELSKLFDASNQSLHINKVVNFTESNLKTLTVDAFKEYNQDRQLLKELTERYMGIQHSDLVDIRDLLDKHKGTIEKLRTYRDSWVAHDDAKKPRRPIISAQEIKDLFDILKKILNTISIKLNDETWSYSHVEGGVKNHLNTVIDHLRRFEPYRLKEIDIELEKKYKSSQQ